jgi:hypothetical protein
MSNVVSYNAPLTISKFMLDEQHEVRLILGPYGSGKTTGCIMELARRMLDEYPDAKGVRHTRFVIVRNTAQQLRQTILEDIRKWLQPVMQYKVTDSTIVFDFVHPTQGKIHSEWMLIPLDKPEDQQRLLSLNITGGWVSEFREIPISVVEALLGRVGRFRPLGVNKNKWCGIIGESNPPDEDSDWYKKLEIERPKNWMLYKQPGGMDPNAENRENLRDGYYESLIESNNSDWVDVHVHAKYGKSLSGQAVWRASFRPDFHITYNDVKPIPGLSLMIGQDFGRTPASLIAQIDTRGRLVIFREALTKDAGIEQFIVSTLRPLMFTHFPGVPSYMIADPSGVHKGQITEESAFDALKRLGFKVYAAPTNDIDPRLRAVEQLFLRQIDGGPAIIIVGHYCPMLVQALKFNYRYRRKKDGQLEDMPEKTHPWSDLADCLQYLALGATGNYIGRILAREQPRVRRPPPSAAGWT